MRGVDIKKLGSRKTRLEQYDPTHCNECGIALPWHAWVNDYDRCPECILDETRDELMGVFGTLDSSEVAKMARYSETAEETEGE